MSTAPFDLFAFNIICHRPISRRKTCQRQHSPRRTASTRIVHYIASCLQIAHNLSTLYSTPATLTSPPPAEKHAPNDPNYNSPTILHHKDSTHTQPQIPCAGHVSLEELGGVHLGRWTICSILFRFVSIDSEGKEGRGTYTRQDIS